MDYQNILRVVKNKLKQPGSNECRQILVVNELTVLAKRLFTTPPSLTYICEVSTAICPHTSKPSIFHDFHKKFYFRSDKRTRLIITHTCETPSDVIEISYPDPVHEFMDFIELKKSNKDLYTAVAIFEASSFDIHGCLN